MFKLSPFKALNNDQAILVEGIIETLHNDIIEQKTSPLVVEGAPGTGKTVVAIYLLKLLSDIRRHNYEDPIDRDSQFAEFFTKDFTENLESFKVGIVIPQQSLGESVSKVFKKTPGLEGSLVFAPFGVGKSEETFDLLIVDEAQRLGQRANQSSAKQNSEYAEINKTLFGEDNYEFTQWDWIRKKSKHVIMMVDPKQTVRPADMPTNIIEGIIIEAEDNERYFRLIAQMRIRADQDYVQYVRDVFEQKPHLKPECFSGYDLQFFDNLKEMRDAIMAQNAIHSLSRVVAGYA